MILPAARAAPGRRRSLERLAAGGQAPRLPDPVLALDPALEAQTLVHPGDVVGGEGGDLAKWKMPSRCRVRSMPGPMPLICCRSSGLPSGRASARGGVPRARPAAGRRPGGRATPCLGSRCLGSRCLGSRCLGSRGLGWGAWGWGAWGWGAWGWGRLGSRGLGLGRLGSGRRSPRARRSAPRAVRPPPDAWHWLLRQSKLVLQPGDAGGQLRGVRRGPLPGRRAGMPGHGELGAQPVALVLQARKAPPKSASAPPPRPGAGSRASASRPRSRAPRR